MADLQALIRAVDELIASGLKQLHNYILEMRVQFVSVQGSLTLMAPRILGLHEHLGRAWMSDDFNDELPQEFRPGEDAQ